MFTETYAPILLHREAAKMRKDSGDDRYYTEFEVEDRSLAHMLEAAFVRPFRMMVTQPIIQVISCTSSVIMPLNYISPISIAIVQLRHPLPCAIHISRALGDAIS
jgi:hypothetical protein